VTAPFEWAAVLAELADAGWTARVVPAERLAEVGERAREAAAGAFPDDVAADMDRWLGFAVPQVGDGARSVVIAAVPRPLTQAVLVHEGRERLVRIPPHYAGYHTTPKKLAATLRAALRPHGLEAADFQPPLKTLAVCSGLARYGWNNIAYVEGLGSNVCLAACVSDAPQPDEHVWRHPVELERCGACGACEKVCPTGAAASDRFLLHTERCLTYHNERTEPMPAWIEPGWRHAAVGCLRCQKACPENAGRLEEAPPERFSEKETAAILAATPAAGLPAVTLAKMQRCGLDYSPELIARNLVLLLADRPTVISASTEAPPGPSPTVAALGTVTAGGERSIVTEQTS
jgi:epoxyqueuosine reductase